MTFISNRLKISLLFVLLSLGGAFIALSPLGQQAQAVEPEEVLDDPVLEAKAREVSQLLRCLVCQNQSIDESNAGLARDLRRLVRERLVLGDTKDETLAYIVSRYGDYVLLRPPVRRHTLILWWAPVFFAIVALAAFIIIFTRSGKQYRQPINAEQLSDDEIRKLKRIMKEKESRK